MHKENTNPLVSIIIPCYNYDQYIEKCIQSVLNQTYKNFEFIGPSPIDYDTHKLYGECVWEELCNFSLNEYIKKGRTKT